MPDSAALAYDYILIDMDDQTLLDSFDIYTAYKNYFVTSPEPIFTKKRVRSFKWNKTTYGVKESIIFK